MTVNELVCTFREGTDIFIHMRYADSEKTERLWNQDASGGIWKGGDSLKGMTRHPIGECTVESGSIFFPAKFGMKADYDVSFVAFEPNFCEKLKELEEKRSSEVQHL